MLAPPCPPWPGFLIENPYTDLVAGAARQIERAGVAPGLRLLDAGCGPGRVTLAAAARVGPSGRVVALDLQPRMLAKLERRLAAGGVGNVETRQGALGDGTLPADAFDVAIASAVLGEVHDRPAALADLYRVLRPGGVLSITDVLPNPVYLPLARVRALARAAGFKEARVFDGTLAYTLNLRKPGGLGRSAWCLVPGASCEVARRLRWRAASFKKKTRRSASPGASTY